MSLSEFLPYAPWVFEKLKIMILADSKKLSECIITEPP
jgi:hypothetical protein